MAEKDWLVRAADGFYHRFESDVAPKNLCAGYWITGDGMPFRGESDVQPDANGLVYGHHLEPGGGPVDVSEWFPSVGRACANCGIFIHGPMENCPHAEVNDCQDNKHWRPVGHNAPAIPPGEEGGRTMLQTWLYEVWRNEKREGDVVTPRERIIKKDAIFETNGTTVRELVLHKHHEDLVKLNLTPADVEVISHPFAR